MGTFSVKLHELRRRKAALKAEYLALVGKETDMPDDEELPEEERNRLVDIENELKRLDARISKVEAALDLESDTTGETAIGENSETALVPPRVKGGQILVPDRFMPYGYSEPPPITEQKGFKMARFAMGLWHAKGGMGMQGAAEWAERRFGDKEVAKALNTAGVATGGALIPQAFSADFIELLRAATVIRRCGPVAMFMPLGNMTIPRLQGGATAGYQGELDDIVMSQESFDDLQLNAKKLTALVPVSNDLIRRAPIGVEALVRDDLTQTVARREDLAFQLGDGSLGQTIGLFNLCPPSNQLTVLPFVSGAVNSVILTAVVNVVTAMIVTLRMNMSRMIRPYWITSPVVEAFLKQLRDDVGNFVFKAELETGKFMGYPMVTTQQLPTNINTGTTGSPVNNGTYLFLVDFADVILAETYNIVIDASDVASYKDNTGNSVSTFTRDQTVFRIIEEHDFNLRHQASVAVAVLPGWAPAGYVGTAGAAYYVQAASGDGSAAPSTWGIPPTGSNNPANIAYVGPGGTLPGRA